jgi:hypothetical protein
MGASSCPTRSYWLKKAMQSSKDARVRLLVFLYLGMKEPEHIVNGEGLVFADHGASSRLVMSRSHDEPRWVYVCSCVYGCLLGGSVCTCHLRHGRACWCVASAFCLTALVVCPHVLTHSTATHVGSEEYCRMFVTKALGLEEDDAAVNAFYGLHKGMTFKQRLQTLAEDVFEGVEESDEEEDGHAEATAAVHEEEQAEEGAEEHGDVDKEAAAHAEALHHEVEHLEDHALEHREALEHGLEHGEQQHLDLDHHDTDEHHLHLDEHHHDEHEHHENDEHGHHHGDDDVHGHGHEEGDEEEEEEGGYHDHEMVEEFGVDGNGLLHFEPQAEDFERQTLYSENEAGWEDAEPGEEEL